jgi:hypothetical protein
MSCQLIKSICTPASTLRPACWARRMMALATRRYLLRRHPDHDFKPVWPYVQVLADARASFSDGRC